MSTKNNPTVGHPPGTCNEALSWLNRNACGEPGMHLVSLRESVRAVSREIDAIKKARDDHFALRLLAEVERDRLRERLDQFDAHGFPNVAAALDRVNAAEARAAELEGELRLAAETLAWHNKAWADRCGLAEAALREIDAKIGHFADMEPEGFPHALIPLVARIVKAALAGQEVGR